MKIRLTNFQIRFLLSFFLFVPGYTFFPNENIVFYVIDVLLFSPRVEQSPADYLPS